MMFWTGMQRDASTRSGRSAPQHRVEAGLPGTDARPCAPAGRNDVERRDRHRGFRQHTARELVDEAELSSESRPARSTSGTAWRGRPAPKAERLRRGRRRIPDADRKTGKQAGGATGARRTDGNADPARSARVESDCWGSALIERIKMSESVRVFGLRRFRAEAVSGSGVDRTGEQIHCGGRAGECRSQFIRLRVGFCQECTHVQLLEHVPPHAMFDEYLYISSASETLKNHLDEPEPRR